MPQLCEPDSGLRLIGLHENVRTDVGGSALDEKKL